MFKSQYQMLHFPQQIHTRKLLDSVPSSLMLTPLIPVLCGEADPMLLPEDCFMDFSFLIPLREFKWPQLLGLSKCRYKHLYCVS